MPACVDRRRRFPSCGGRGVPYPAAPVYRHLRWLRKPGRRYASTPVAVASGADLHSRRAQRSPRTPSSSSISPAGRRRATAQARVGGPRQRCRRSGRLRSEDNRPSTPQRRCPPRTGMGRGASAWPHRASEEMPSRSHANVSAPTDMGGDGTGPSASLGTQWTRGGHIAEPTPPASSNPLKTLVERMGIEPTTSRMQIWRSPG